MSEQKKIVNQPRPIQATSHVAKNSFRLVGMDWDAKTRLTVQPGDVYSTKMGKYIGRPCTVFIIDGKQYIEA